MINYFLAASMILYVCLAGDVCERRKPGFGYRPFTYYCRGPGNRYSVKWEKLSSDDEISVKLLCDEGGFDCQALLPLDAKNYTSSIKIKNCHLPIGQSLKCINKATGIGNTTRIDIEFKETDELNESHFVDFESLQTLFLEYGNVTPKALDNLQSLKKISIRNSVLFISKKMFESSKDLEFLYISKSNIINSFPPKPFQHLRNLKTLEIYDFSINVNMVDLIYGLTHLEKLVLNNNSISIIETSYFSEMTALKELHMIGHKLKKIPSNTLSGLKNLIEINLVGTTENKTIVKNKAFANMLSLMYVNISRCNISTIPEDLLVGSDKLLSLNLQDNKIREVPRGLLLKKSELETLILTKNKLRKLSPEVFASLNNLKTLCIDHNKLINITSGMLSNLQNLTTLFLSHNRLEYLDEDVFEGLKSLHTLHLEHNSLHSPSTFLSVSNLSGLLMLQMSNNKFADVLDLGAGTLLEKNMTLDLSDNQITSIRISDPSMWQFRLNIAKNPIKYDCWTLQLVQHGTNVYGLKENITPEDLLCTESCADKCVCTARPYRRIFEVICDEQPDAKENERIDEYYKNYTNLNMDLSLRLKELPQVIRLSPNVHTLDMSNLDLTKVPSFNSHNLSRINLANNSLSILPVDIIYSGGPKVILTGNMFICDCTHLDKVSHVKRFWKNIQDYRSVMCKDGYLFTKDLPSVSELCNSFDVKSMILYLSILITLVLLVVTISYKFRYKLKPLCYSTVRFCNCTAKRKPYDVYVSFTKNTADFVTQELLPVLSSKKIYLAERDWEVGERIRTLVLRSVNNANCTLVVVDSDSLTDLNSDVAVLTSLKIARDRHVRGETKLIILTLDTLSGLEVLSPDLKACFRSNVTVKWNAEYKKKCWRVINRMMDVTDGTREDIV